MSAGVSGPPPRPVFRASPGRLRRSAQADNPSGGGAAAAHLRPHATLAAAWQAPSESHRDPVEELVAQASESVKERIIR
jgi:hypothetical protein